MTVHSVHFEKRERKHSKFRPKNWTPHVGATAMTQRLLSQAYGDGFETWLWVRVIVRAAMDACGMVESVSGTAESKDLMRHRARRWFGTRDFAVAASVIDLDPEWVLLEVREFASKMAEREKSEIKVRSAQDTLALIDGLALMTKAKPGSAK